MAPLMETTTLTPRAPAPARPDAVTRILGKPAAYLATAAVLLALFGWTFVANPDRVAPTKDPAYYTWRTQVITQEPPEVSLGIEGAFGMFEGGYRVTAPVLGGYLTEAADISTLRMTVVLMVILPVIVALLLAGFAYRHRRDPLLWHSVALGSGSLLLTPPFVGYLDNMLCLVFLAASLYLIPSTRTSWSARAMFFAFLLAAGFTHPTTLVIFCLVLGAMATAKLLFRRFDLRSVIAEDGPLLVTAAAAAIATVALWTVGMWGKSASLGESALSPPYGSGFFIDRLLLWVNAMTPVLNGPLFVIGLVGLIASARRAWVDDELTRVSVVWLIPLVGIFGFIGGLAYPYYRFFNTTLAWVLLVGVGIWFVARYLLEVARGKGAGYLALAGVFALVVIVFVNFTKGFDLSGWNNPSGGWMSPTQKAQLDELRASLEVHAEGRPVVFVVDDEPAQPFQIWGFTKLSGNTSRYAMPEGSIADAYLYLGSLENYLAGEPTVRDEVTYDRVSRGTLEDARAGIERSGSDPIVVVAAAFNPAGSNEGVVTAEAPIETQGQEVWLSRADGTVERFTGNGEVEIVEPGAEQPAGSFVDILWALAALAIMLIPGYLAFKWLLPAGGVAEALGMVPALSITLLALVGIAVIAVTRSPFSLPVVWASIALAIAGTAALAWRSRRSVVEAAPARP